MQIRSGQLARWIELHGWIRGVYANPYATEYLPNSVTNVTPTIVAGLSNGVSAIFKQEDGNNANGAAITSFVQSADFDISDEEAGVVDGCSKIYSGL